MIRYTIRRVLTLIPVLLIVIFVVYFIMSFAGGDPVRMMVGTQAPQEKVDLLRTQMGLDKPFIVQYFNYIKDIVLHLDFGNSYTSRQPVFNEIAHRLPPTLILTVITIVVSVVIALPMGIFSAIKQYSALDNINIFFSMCLIAVPSVWLGFMLMLFFSYTLKWLPSGGIESWQGFILPSITLAATSIALYLRMIRSSMLEVVRQDYVRTARGKGIGKFKTIVHHTIKNAILPVITIIGMDFGALIGGTIIIENVFSIPGLGRLMVESMRAKNLPVVMGSVIVLAVVFAVMNLIVDLIYAAVDPRIKAEYLSGDKSRFRIRLERLRRTEKSGV